MAPPSRPMSAYSGREVRGLRTTWDRYARWAEPSPRTGGALAHHFESATPQQDARIAAVLHGGEACMTISMSRAERADLGQRGAQPGAARSRTHADERTTVPVDTAEGGRVVRLAHLLRLNPPDGRSSHIEWQPEGHRRL